MSTMHRNSNPWSSPKDQNPLKRRHARGNTSHSHTSSIRSLSLSPAVSSVSLSANDTSVKSAPAGFKNNNNNHLQPPHSSRRPNDLHDFHDLNSNSSGGDYHDFHRDKHQNDTATTTTSGAGVVPSWFGSLRSFAISATSSSRGAFTPLNTSSSSASSTSSTSSSSSATSSPTLSSKPSSSHSKKCRGRSSSIYYSSTLLDDDESDSEWSSGQNEPITSLNGLKENRVRGPRVNWMALDPSLGSFFAGGSYKPLSMNESDLELASPDGHGVGHGYGGGEGGVEELGISEMPYRDDNDDNDDEDDHDDEEGGSDDEGRTKGYGRGGSGRAKVKGGKVGGDEEDEAWARAMEDATVPDKGGFTMPVAVPSSTLAFLKSYVPSLSGSSDSSTTATTTTTTTSTTTPAATAAVSPTSTGGGFWSLRKISMNFLSGHQYTAVNADKDKATTESSEDEDEQRQESGDDYQQLERNHQPREQGRRAGYRDDYEDDADEYYHHRHHHQYGDRSMRMDDDDKEMTRPLSGGGLTVSYLASMVQNATQVGAQYIPVPVSSRSLKKD